MRDVKDGNLQTILAPMQKMSDYHAKELRIYEEQFSGLTAKTRLERNASDKETLRGR